MTSPSLALGLSLLFINFPAPAIPDAVAHIPPVHGITFSDTRVDLPDALHGKVGILVLGFTQGSRSSVTDWGKKLAADFYDSPTVLYYEMPMLAAVPRFLRGFVENRIKASVSDRGRPHFLPLTDDEAKWRNLTHYTAPDDPYILLVDHQGTIRWQTQGPPSETTYTALRREVETLRPH